MELITNTISIFEILADYASVAEKKVEKIARARDPIVNFGST